MDATVYVGLDNRIAVPSWMGTWTNTGDIIVNAGSEIVNYALYSKHYTAGAVSLGGNEETQPENSMYIVLAKPDEGQSPDQSEAQATGGIATVCLQSTTSEGTTTVSATVNGLTRGTVQVETLAILPEPAKVLVNANPTSIIADGSDTSTITARICDSDDNKVTTSTEDILFSVSGEGSLVGNTVKAAVNGVITIALQSTLTTGAATVTATAADLTQDTAVVTTTPDPDAPVKVIASAVPTSIVADGSDTSTITARICDSDNATVTTSTEDILFSVSGEGSLVGTTVKAAVNGEMTIVLKSTLTTGAATVTATADSLTEGTVAVETTDIPNTAPQVTGITAIQAAGTGNVLIGYDLSDSEQSAVDIEIRYYNGTIVQACTTLNGAEGTGVTTGNGKQVTWNAKLDFDGEYRTDVYIQIHADDGGVGGTVDVNSAVLTLDTKVPEILTNVEVQPLPVSGDSSLILHAVWAEDSPGTPEFDYNLNGAGYAGSEAGTAGNDSTKAFSVNLDGDDVITSIKSGYTDAYGNTASDDENTNEVYVKPLVPEAPEVMSATETSLALTINANSGENGTVWYVIKATSTGGEEYVQGDGTLDTSPVWQTATAWGAPVMVTGLGTGTEYYFSMSAGNPNDSSPEEGENSASGYGISASGTPEAAAVNPPTNLAVASYGRHEIRLTWQGGTANDRYVVEKSTDGNDFKEIVSWDNNLRAAEYTDTGLKVGTQYWYRVYGCDEFTNRSVYAGLTQKTVEEVIVNLETGGLVEEENVEVDVSSGTFTGDSYIDITINPEKDIIGVANEKATIGNLAGSITELNAYTADGNKLGVNDFKLGILMKIYYDTLDISTIVEDTLRIYVLDEANGRWNRVGGEVNTSEHCVSATVEHFSVYCLMGESSEGTVDIVNAISYPNPTTGGTIFSFELTKSASVKVEVYTISGRLVKGFAEVAMDAGYNEVPEGELWDGKDDGGESLGSGIYYWKITATDAEGTDQETGKLVILR